MRETVVKTEEFKDSPLGRIPKDWDVKPLSELADVDRGKFTHRPRNDPRFYGGSYPFIQTGDIANSSGGILSTYSQTLNERGITVSREFPVGTIAITIAANIADTAILGIPMFFPDSVVGAVVKKPNSIRYVELCIRRAKQRLDARAPQSAQKNINLEDLRPLLIPVPSPEEQHRIAEVIDTIDSAIAHTSSLIAKLKQMKAGLLHDLLTRGLDENGELRDAIAHPEQFKDSPLGQIPQEWKFCKFGDQVTLQRGFDITSKEMKPGNVPVIASSGLVGYHDTPMANPPGVITGRKGSLGEAFYVEEPYYPTDTTLWVKDFHGNYPKFIRRFIQWMRLERLDSATACPTLNRNFVHPIPVAFPPIDEQIQI
jgi:restriction endonuclease S subunit